MDPKALRRQTGEEFVAEAVPTVPEAYRRYAKLAAELAYDIIPHVGDALSRVSSIAALMLQREGESTLPLTSSDLALSDLICEGARPMAEAIRQDVFGKTKVPFKDMATAIKWVEKEAKSMGPAEGLKQEAAGMVNRIVKLCQEASASGLTVEVRFEKQFLYYPSALPTDPPGPRWARPVDASFHRKLRLLSKRVEELAEQTGWHEANALMFVLAGAKTLTPRFQLHSRSTEIRQWWELEIGTNTVSREDITKILAGMRPKQGRKRPLTDKGVEVFVFAKQYRPAKTWPWILAEWNKKHPEQAYKTVRGLRMAYSKLLPGAKTRTATKTKRKGGTKKRMGRIRRV